MARWTNSSHLAYSNVSQQAAHYKTLLSTPEAFSIQEEQSQRPCKLQSRCTVYVQFPSLIQPGATISSKQRLAIESRGIADKGLLALTSFEEVFSSLENIRVASHACHHVGHTITLGFWSGHIFQDWKATPVHPVYAIYWTAIYCILRRLQILYKPLTKMVNVWSL